MPDPMKSPVTTFLYVLMRDHLPIGTVRFLIEQAQRAGEPTYSAPELEALAKRYADELLMAPPRGGVDDEEELPPAPVGLPGSSGKEASPPPPAAEPRTPAPAPRAPRGQQGRVSPETVNAFLELLRREGGRCPSGAFDELGKSTATRARVIRELREDNKVHIEYEGGVRYGQRVVVLTPENCTCVFAPLKGHKPDERVEVDPDCPAHPSVAAPAGAHSSESSAEGRGQTVPGNRGAGGSPPVETPPADATPGGASEDNPPPPAPPPSEEAVLIARAARLLDEADGEVWPREFEAALGITATKRLMLVEKMKGEGKLIIAGSGGPRVRYRSAKKARPGATGIKPGAGASTREAAEPIGSGTSHLRDRTKEREAAALDEAKADEAKAAEVLPSVREWVSGAGTFTARQLRDVFDIERAVCTRIIAALMQEKSIESTGDPRANTYCSVTANGNGQTERGGKRPLGGAGNERATLESRALGSLHGDGRTLEGLASHLGVSEEVAQKIAGKLQRDGEVRLRRRGGDVHYAAVG